jgi:3-isopropylmalate/(R)-2-methylmalate dehydratase large subunit
MTTLLDRIWEMRTVREEEGRTLLFVDLHLVFEVSSPQAFEGLRLAGRGVRRPDLTIATMDHVVETEPRRTHRDESAAVMLGLLRRNCEEFGVPLNATGSGREGIVHVMGPELGLTQPGIVIACGDSHTTTHGAFGALAPGIGTSEVEHVLATQTLWLRKPRSMRVRLHGELPPGVTAKDVALHLIGQIGVDGGTGHVLEYQGEGLERLSMESRMTLCNMSIEAGARAALVAPDDVTFGYLEGREYAPTGSAWNRALDRWRTLRSDPDAEFDKAADLDLARVEPQVTWGTNPGMVVSIDGRVPDPASLAGEADRAAAERALEYMGIEPGTRMTDLHVDHVFIGSCTNSRIEDLRAAAEVVDGRRVHPGVAAIVVPGSARVRRLAEEEGLDRVFVSAGMEWRLPGCSMCLAMNGDTLGPGERCASTSNRNFEGRQGVRGRTHLVSPAVAAATAIAGHFATPAQLA